MNSIHSDYTFSFAARQHTQHTADAAQALERISSGYRINSAADDPAGLGVSERMRAEITGLETAIANARDGQNLVGMADGALGEVHTMLNRLAGIAGQAANGTLEASQRQSLQQEADQLLAEIERIAKATQWHDQPLLDGSPAFSEVSLQVGTTDRECDKITVRLPNLNSILEGLNGFSVLTQEQAGASLQLAKTAIDRTSAARAQLGALSNRLGHTINSLTSGAENLTEAESRVRDADIAKEMSRFVRSTTLAQAARMVMSHAMHQKYRILDLLRTI